MAAEGYRTRWLFFWLFAWMQCHGRFMSLYYQDEGLTEAQIGSVFAVGSFFSQFAGMTIAVFADKLSEKYGPQARLHCFTACVCVASLAFFLQMFAWPGVSQFWQLLICRLALDLRTTANTLLTAVTVNAIPDRQQYGVERLYGAVSWAIVGLALGILQDSYGTRVIYVFMPPTLLCLFLTIFFNRDVPRTHEVKVAKPDAAPPVGAICPLMKSYGSSAAKITFFIFAITLGIGMTFVENLLFLYFRELNTSYSVCGLSIVVTVLFEIPLFGYTGQLLAVLGTRGLLAVAGLAYSLRAVGYTIVPGGAWVLLFEPLHGVTFATWQTASVEAMAIITPKELMATGQSFLVFMRGMGVTAGNFGGGFVIEQYGEAFLYRSSAILVGAGLCLFLLCSRGGLASQPGSLTVSLQPPAKEVA